VQNQGSNIQIPCCCEINSSIAAAPLVSAIGQLGPPRLGTRPGPAAFIFHEQDNNHRDGKRPQIGLAAVDHHRSRDVGPVLDAHLRSWAMGSARRKPACRPLRKHRGCCEGGASHGDPDRAEAGAGTRRARSQTRPARNSRERQELSLARGRRSLRVGSQSPHDSADLTGAASLSKVQTAWMMPYRRASR
jgi:hypothetical protein